MADIFDQIAGNVAPGAASAGDIFDQIAGNVPTASSAPAAGAGDWNLNSVSGQLGKGAALGWFDEIQASEAAFHAALRDPINAVFSPVQTTKGLFGFGTSPEADAYNRRVTALRARDAAVEAAHPYESTGLQFAGALLPAAASGGAAALTGEAAAARAAKGAVESAIADIFGAGSGAPFTVKRLAGVGAGAGGIAGAGMADNGDRLTGGAMGATLGAVAAPVIGGAVQAGTNYIGDLWSRFKVSRPGVAAAESGAVGSGRAISDLSPADLYLAKQLKNTPLDRVQAGAGELSAAVDNNVPLFLPEAVNSAKVSRNARFVANYEPSMDFSQQAINSRAASAGDRITDLLDTVSSERNPYVGSMNLKQAADDVLGQATKARSDEVKALYSKAYKETPLITDPAVLNLIEKDKPLQSAIAKVKEHAQYADMPDNSLDVLHQAKQMIGDKAESASIAGERNTARLYTDKYTTINKALKDASPAYAQATEKYAALSTGVNELEQSKLSFLAALHPDKIDQIGQIFSLQPQRIAELKASFEAAGHGEVFQQGVRAYLQNLVDKAPTENGGKALQKMIQSPRQQEALRAALGDKYETVMNGLQLEQRMYQGRSQYHAGSSTAGNLAEYDEFGRGVSAVSKFFSGDKVAALRSLFAGDMPEELAQGLADIYFNPKKGSESLNRIMPLLEDYARNKTVARMAGSAASTGTTRAAMPEQKPRRGAKAAQQPAPGQQSSAIDSVFRSGKMQGTKADIEKAIDGDPYYSALYEAESSRNPKAQNTKTSAGGAFQFTDATAKSVGLKDKYDIGQSFDAVQKLTDSNAAIVGDDPVAKYSAHYLGATLARKVQTGAKLSAGEQAIVNEFYDTALPRFMRIYNRITGTTEA